MSVIGVLRVRRAPAAFGLRRSQAVGSGEFGRTFPPGWNRIHGGRKLWRRRRRGKALRRPNIFAENVGKIVPPEVGCQQLSSAMSAARKSYCARPASALTEAGARRRNISRRRAAEPRASRPAPVTRPRRVPARGGVGALRLWGCCLRALGGGRYNATAKRIFP